MQSISHASSYVTNYSLAARRVAKVIVLISNRVCSDFSFQPVARKRTKVLSADVHASKECGKSGQDFREVQGQARGLVAAAHAEIPGTRKFSLGTHFRIPVKLATTLHCTKANLFLFVQEMSS